NNTAALHVGNHTDTWSSDIEIYNTGELEVNAGGEVKVDDVLGVQGGGTLDINAGAVHAKWLGKNGSAANALRVDNSGILTMDGAASLLAVYGCYSESTSYRSLFFNTTSTIAIADGTVKFGRNPWNDQPNCYVNFGTQVLKNVEVDTSGTKYIRTEHLWNVNGNMTLTSGNLNSTNQNINLGGNWAAVAGTYTGGTTGTVTFFTPSGGTYTHNVSGATTFNHLACSTAGSTLIFGTGAANATTVNGNLTLAGASGNPIAVRSSVAGEYFLLSVKGTTRTATWTTVKDSDASFSSGKHMDATSNCTNLGHNRLWLFTSACTAPLCTVNTVNTGFMGIQRVELAGLNNYTGTVNNEYEDFSWLVTNVTRGSTYTLAVTGWTYEQYFKAWIDWNRDCDFLDEGEEIDIGTVEAVSSSVQLTIPAFAIAGNVKMRIRSDFYLAGTPDTECVDLQYGETEDYTLNILY
ncbi:MAG: hypothetical protein FJ098_06185, partial [Deltaproteobacteria bacterium]|nr:hypothetical protein [Deltaproteobacteria bacterium]